LIASAAADNGSKAAIQGNAASPGP
jgi:hypothetical protein